MGLLLLFLCEGSHEGELAEEEDVWAALPIDQEKGVVAFKESRPMVPRKLKQCDIFALRPSTLVLPFVKRELRGISALKRSARYFCQEFGLGVICTTELLGNRQDYVLAGEEISTSP